jgi:hypothetical protein
MSPEAQHILATLEDGEPVFILRGNDPYAARALFAWLAVGQEHDVDPATLRRGWRTLLAMQRWARAHGVKVGV